MPTTRDSAANNLNNQNRQTQPLLFPIVGLGASAGGLEAVGDLLNNLPSATGMAFIFVQHLAPDHTSLLSEILSQKTAMPVTEAAQGQRVEPNHVYVIPPNTGLTIARGCLVLNPRNDAAGVPMPIDAFFNSLAEDQGANAIGISLSGSGTDGALGIQAIKNEGGITFAQDAVSAQYTSMPQAAIRSGCIDFVLPPQDIAQELVRISRQQVQKDISVSTPETVEYDEADLQRIFNLLHNSCNLDFTHYKRGTVKRRLARRLALRNLHSLADYIGFITVNPDELTALGQDFLIHVTHFFRDPDSFESLEQYIFPRIINERSPKTPIRIWVPGCSTGEEVYSIAICCLEYLRNHGIGAPIQIFGTDVSEEALQAARAGIYAENIERNVSPERLERYFTKIGDRFQISKSVRNLCIFARHDVTSDPPFSQLDLISCRNLLIYLNPLLQKRIIPLFHYALKPEGILILGPAENIGGFADIFTLEDNKKIKFYTKAPLSAQSQLKYLEGFAGKAAYSPLRPSLAPLAYTDPLKKKYSETEEQKREADRITHNRFVPAAVLCDKNLNILEFRGDTGLYLTQPSGAPEVNLQKLARPGLLIEISKAVHKAGKEGVTVCKQGLRIDTLTGIREINLEVTPVQRSAAGEPWFLIFFEDKIRSAPATEKASGFWTSIEKMVTRQGGRNGSAAAPQHLESARSKLELDDTHDYIRTMISEYDLTKEELQASQEELLSSNEELQSTNEELETAKEELQSANEELLTTNEGVHHRNQELKELNDKSTLALNYAEAVLNTAHQPFLVLDGDLHILRANPAFYKAFKTTPETTQGRLLYDLGDRQWDIPELRQFLQALLLQDTSFKDCEITHAFPDVGMKTMRLNGTNLVGGAQLQILLAIEDVSDYRTAMNTLKELNDKSTLALNYAEAVLNTAHQPFLVLDGGLHILRANPAFYKAFKTTPATTEGRLLYDLGDRQWDIPELRQFLQALLLQDTSFKDCEITHAFPDVGMKTMRLNGTNLVGGEQLQILLAIEDVSDYRMALNTLKELNDKSKLALSYSDAVLNTAHQPFLVLDGGLHILRANPAFYKAFKTTPETTEGRLLYDLGDRQWDIPELREFLQALLLQDTSFKDCEITHAFPDVGMKTMRLNGTNLVGGEQLQILLAIEDVSDYRTALNTLKDNDRHKDEFLAMLAHELRNPLAPIRNALEIWKSGAAGKPAEKEAQMIMGRQLQQMLRLVDDLLDVARITRGVVILKKDPVDLVQLITQTTESARHHFDARQHVLSLSLPKEKIFVRGDAIRLEQVVSNLLINAAKYTEPGGHIVVTLEHKMGNALIRVTDNGVGISPDLLPYVFDLFVQEERSLDRKQGGLGLGLTLVRRLVELHGGTVEAKSQGLKRGREFTVRLPMMSGAEFTILAVPDAAPKQTPFTGRRILIIDDNADASMTTQMLLELRGHSVQTAVDGSSGLKAALLFKPEVILLDIGLPGMDGYEVARRLRDLPLTKNVLLIAVSGYGQAEDLRKATEAGFDYHLLKPADTNQLQDLISGLDRSVVLLN
jgi:two-component system CheB/CheR fusion protein